MAKDPAFLLYYQDFLVGTSDMDNEEVGAYIRCLCYQAAKGDISEKHMKNICLRQEIQNTVKSKFKIDTDTGNLFNERLRIELKKRKDYSESRANNRKKRDLNKKDMINISESYVQHMENENENENIDINKDRKGGVGEKQTTGSICIYDPKILKAEMLASETWLTDIAMKLNLELSVVIDRVADFVDERRINDEMGKSFSEYKRHFYNLIKKTKVNGTTRNDQSSVERAIIAGANSQYTPEIGKDR